MKLLGMEKKVKTAFWDASKNCWQILKTLFGTLPYNLNRLYDYIWPKYESLKNNKKNLSHISKYLVIFSSLADISFDFVKAC